MHDEVLVAIYPSRADAERARDGLRNLGVPADDIALSADTAAVGGGPAAGPDSSGFPDRFFERRPPDDEQNWSGFDPVGDDRTVVAVRLDRAGAGRERIVDALALCRPLGFEGDTAATASETDLIEPEPAGWVSERVGGMPSGSFVGDSSASSADAQTPEPRPGIRSYPIGPSKRV